MRLYIDLSCFNRPFDDQGQERIRRETQAVLDVLRRIIEGSDTLVWSWVLSFENDKHPKPDRRDEIAVWEARSERSIAVNADLEERTRQIAQQGIPALDAAHLASAEAGAAEIMLTCDDVVLRRAARVGVRFTGSKPCGILKRGSGAWLNNLPNRNFDSRPSGH